MYRRRLDKRNLAASKIFFYAVATDRQVDLVQTRFYLRYHNSAIRIQREYRERHTQYRSKASAIQRYYRQRRRGRLGLNFVVQKVSFRRLNATHIQRVWRGYLGRKRARRKEVWHARQERAALKLQRAWAIKQGYFPTFVLMTPTAIIRSSRLLGVACKTPR